MLEEETTCEDSKGKDKTEALGAAKIEDKGKKAMLLALSLAKRLLPLTEGIELAEALLNKLAGIEPEKKALAKEGAALIKGTKALLLNADPTKDEGAKMEELGATLGVETVQAVKTPDRPVLPKKLLVKGIKGSNIAIPRGTKAKDKAEVIAVTPVVTAKGKVIGKRNSEKGLATEKAVTAKELAAEGPKIKLPLLLMAVNAAVADPTIGAAMAAVANKAVEVATPGSESKAEGKPAEANNE